MRRKIKATPWDELHPDHPRPGLAVFDAPALGGGNKYFACGGGEVEELEETARRLAALWNAAEDIGSTTNEIEDGVIQFAFELGERHAEVINAAKERIEKLEAEKAEACELIHALLTTVPRGSFFAPLILRTETFIEGTIEKARGESVEQEKV